MRLIFGIFVLLVITAATAAARAEVPAAARTTALRPANPYALSGDPATQCEVAAASAENTTRLPQRLLTAISLTETGRVDPGTGSLRPWPWTINAQGQGQFFATKQQAIAAVRALSARGVQSVDVGCMQVNLFYHPAAFASLDQAFDPRANAAYAARFLTSLRAGGRDWAHAIAAYHSETPALGEPYRLMVMARWQSTDRRSLTSTSLVYRDFGPADQVYGAFSLPSRAYATPAAPLLVNGQIRPSWSPHPHATDSTGPKHLPR